MKVDNNIVVREGFDSRSNIVAKSTVCVDNILKLSKVDIKKIYHNINKFGFSMVEPKLFTDSNIDFIKFSQNFGTTVQHERANSHGITEIRQISGFSDFFGTGNEATGLHTDGSYLNNPPEILILQCINPSKIGGKTQLVSAKFIFDELVKENTTARQMLFHENCYKIQRGEKFLTRPVFWMKGSSTCISFRSNGKAKIYVKKKCREAFKLLQEIINNDKNILSFKINKQQILILDNLGVLHGREAFPKSEDRYLKRIFINRNCESRKKIQLGFSH